MRFVLAVSLALHLCGIPAVVGSPCASAPQDETHACCVRHHTETGGDVIGHCGCAVPRDSAPQASETSVAPSPSGSAQHAAAPVLLATGLGLPGDGLPGASPVLTVPDHGPPWRLSGTGFRC